MLTPTFAKNSKIVRISPNHNIGLTYLNISVTAQNNAASVEISMTDSQLSMNVLKAPKNTPADNHKLGLGHSHSRGCADLSQGDGRLMIGINKIDDAIVQKGLK